MSNSVAVRVFIAMTVTLVTFGWGITHGIGWLYSLLAGYGASCFVSATLNGIISGIREGKSK